jgi:alpha-glucosidase
VQDYFQIDPRLGDNEYFARLVKRLHKNGIRIILDGVFNHSGVACRWFNLPRYYPEPGAYQSLESPFAEFYTYREHPEDYYCWCGVKTLPKLNYRSQKLREMLYRGKSSVIQYWLRPPYQIDGWRLDVANMIARQEEYQEYREVFREMRQAIKNISLDAYFMGEHFFDATDLLQGDGFDAAMNYLGFALPIRTWLTGTDGRDGKNEITTEDLDRQFTQTRARISWQIASMQYNLINCHDLPRLLSLVNSPKKNRLAAILLMTYLGIPSIYYGDEIGMGSDQSVESTRRPMLWNPQGWDHDLMEFYQRLIDLRKNSNALTQGGIKTLWDEGDVYSYARFYEKEIVIMVVNRGEAAQITLDVGIIGLRQGEYLKNFFTGRKIRIAHSGEIKLAVPACEGIIIIP